MNISDYTKLAASRRFAQTLDPKQARLFKVLMGEEGMEVADVCEQIDFEFPASDRVTAGSFDPQSELLLGALGYALGRHTGIVTYVATDIRNNWDDIDVNTRETISFVIQAALDSNKAGMGMDRSEWERVLARADAEISPAL